MATDVLIVCGGVSGLSVAYELAGHGLRVQVIDRGEPGREASWAGAGILPASKFRTRAEPRDWLAGYSGHLHAEWSARLREETGIDNGYRRCGGVYLAEDDAAAGELLAACEQWRREGLNAKWLHAADLDKLEPALAEAYDRFPLRGAATVAEEAQIRNPRHVRALLAGCAKRGVLVRAGVELFDVDRSGDRIVKCKTSVGDLTADKIVLASGAWSGGVATKLGFHLRVRPIRGQIVLFDCGRARLSRVVNVGRRYLVPRDDGRLLVGSTEEDVGFDRRGKAESIEALFSFAIKLAPELGDATVERAWTGFRPASHDGWPYLGRAPNDENLLIAAGHFRQGLWLSPGTAVVMSRLVRGESPGVDLAPFAIDRP